MFNYKLYLETENIFVLTTVKGETICEISKANLSFFDNLRARFIGRVENVFDKYLSKNNSAILKSIILGNYSYLDSDILVQYRELGIAHILAVSGLHIGIIAAFLISVFTYIGLDRKINYILTICTIWIYGFLIGYPSSVLRALIMFTVLYYSMMIFQRYDSINSLFFAAFIILAANPLALFSAGFQLSFLATFFILYLVPKLKPNFYNHRNNTLYNIGSSVRDFTNISILFQHHFYIWYTCESNYNTFVVIFFGIGFHTANNFIHKSFCVFYACYFA